MGRVLFCRRGGGKEKKGRANACIHGAGSYNDDKHHMTLNIIPIKQQRFMGLSRLLAAGPPDPERRFEDAVRLSKLNRRLTEFSIEQEQKQKQLKDKRAKRTFRLGGKTLVGCTFHSRDAKCLSFWT